MKVEVLLSALNLKKNVLNSMNISTSCLVINQCSESRYEKYKNFRIYSFNETGVSKSRNRCLEFSSGDILLLSDDDVIYSDNLGEQVINEFKKNPKADVIMFNFLNPYRDKRINKRRKRIRFFNAFNYASYNIAFKRKCINYIRFNTLFGPGGKYSHGEDTLFINDMLKSRFKIYTSPVFLGRIRDSKSTWFKGYNDAFFYDKGALLTAINPKIRHFLIIQYLLRYKSVWKGYSFFSVYKIMILGSNSYVEVLHEENK